MSELLKTVNGPGVQGLHPANTVITVKTSEAITQYDLVQFDLAKVAVSGTEPGVTNSVLYTVRKPDVTTSSAAAIQNCRAFLFGVAQESAASNGTLKVMVVGITPAAATSGTAYAGGEALIVQNADTHRLGRATGKSGNKIVGLVIGTAASDGTPTPTILFNGITGFGCDAFSSS